MDEVQGADSQQTEVNDQVITDDHSESDIQEASFSEPTEQEIQSWDKDKRFNEMWKGDPNNLYKSYKNIEKSYGAVTKERDTYKQQFTTHDQRVKELEGRVKEADEIRKVIDFFDSNPVYQKELLGVLEKLTNEQKRMKYGDLPPEAISKLEKAEQIERRFQEMEQEQQVQQIHGVIDQQLKEIDQIAKENGISYDQSDLLAFARKNGYSPERLSEVFSKKVLSIVKQNAAREASVKTLKTATSNRLASMPASGTRVTPGSSNLKDKVLNMLMKAQ